MSALFAAPSAFADVGTFETTHTLYHEAPLRSNMTVYSPSVDATVSPTSAVEIKGGWEADIVSGASVAVKAGSAYQATNPGVDVITTASVKDVRNVGRGGVRLSHNTTQLALNYSYSTENDYKSHSFDVAARSDFFDRNTNFEISYARNFDKVCDRVQGVNDPAARFRSLENSDGCFAESPLRITRPFVSDNFQVTWSQSWTPIFVTQVVGSLQIGNGFQSNPYRSVVLGEGIKAQEHHPENRARGSGGLRLNLFIKPIKSAARLFGRAYADTWSVKSATVELEFEKYFGESFLAMLRGRFYKQSGALFFSDDYSGGARPLGPKGQYFTGDRELSPFFSVTLGGRLMLQFRGEEKKLLGFLDSLKVSASFDMVHFSYDEFTLGGAPITNARAWIGGAAVNAAF
ncbi:MAG: DUF3570 domain-containing protein [Polyangiaceae bacterium]|nr:DUF3570 domain-containing protein [Polyangiaceae bacterium]